MTLWFIWIYVGCVYLTYAFVYAIKRKRRLFDINSHSVLMRYLQFASQALNFQVLQNRIKWFGACVFVRFEIIIWYEMWQNIVIMWINTYLQRIVCWSGIRWVFKGLRVLNTSFKYISMHTQIWWIKFLLNFIYSRNHLNRIHLTEIFV